MPAVGQSFPLGYVAVFVCVTVVSTAAQGQPPTRPPATQPGQVEKQFQKPPEPTAKPGTIAIPTAGQQPPPNAEGVTFVLKQLTVDGATVYRPEALRSAYAGDVGKEVSLLEIYRVAERLTARYRNDGFILSQVIVPAQTVEDGAIHLQAVEGYIANVRIEGGGTALSGRVKKYADKIQASRPLKISVLERNVLLINDLPGIVAHAVLAQSTEPGASDLILQVSQHRASPNLSSDNRGGEAQGPGRVAGDLDAHGLVGPASRTELRVVTTFTPALNYAVLAHDQFVGAEGGRIGFAASYSYSKPQELGIVPLDLTTSSVTLNLGYTQTIVRRRSHNLYLRGVFSTFDSTTKVFGVDDTIDHVRSASVGATFDSADRLGGVNVVDVAFFQGLHALGASRNGEQLLSRATGRVDFRKATLYAQRMQSLAFHWSFVAAVSGQYAFTDLLSSEMFSVGGELLGRGYDPSALLNDHGAGVKLELLYSRTWNGRRPVALMPYVFGDSGTVWQRTHVPGIDSSAMVVSAGGGVRLNVGYRLAGFAEAAKPFDAIPGQDSSRNLRIYVGVSVR